jgi:hypothetical protein
MIAVSVRHPLGDSGLICRWTRLPVADSCGWYEQCLGYLDSLLRAGLDGSARDISGRMVAVARHHPAEDSTLPGWTQFYP